MRQWVERKQGIPEGSFIQECLITACFGSCATAQEVRELGGYGGPGGESMARE
jgi:hypothetical protein